MEMLYDCVRETLVLSRSVLREVVERGVMTG